MANETVTYSKSVEGWTSFWSYMPDWMIGMNNNFYTWRDGELYKHDSNQTRNNFYGTQYNSSIVSIFSQDVLSVKMYKTISLDSSHTWNTTITTDLSTGEITSAAYKEKEGNFYAYIRRSDDGTFDLKAMSTQGVGNILSYSSLVFNFNFSIGTSISQGDKLYIQYGTQSVLQGTIASHANKSITLSSLVSAILPAPGDYVFIVKNAQAESYGARGYYMQIDLTNGSTVQEEIFSISYLSGRHAVVM